MKILISVDQKNSINTVVGMLKRSSNGSGVLGVDAKLKVAAAYRHCSRQ